MHWFVVYLTTVSVFQTSGHLKENSGVFLVLKYSGRNLTHSKFFERTLSLRCRGLIESTKIVLPTNPSNKEALRFAEMSDMLICPTPFYWRYSPLVGFGLLIYEVCFFRLHTQSHHSR